MTQYMLMFSLGPVQSFIAQARKTRDLWLGSFLLSTLMEAGMKGIPESALIFPDKPFIKNNIPDLPNKYVAVFDTLDAAQQCAVQTEKTIKDVWRSICRDIWKAIIVNGHVKESDRDFVQVIWDRQTNPDTFFEIYWAITARNQSTYAEWLKHTQQALDARKRLRNFASQSGEHGEKSTISGEREALHGRGLSRPDVKKFWQDLTRQPYFSARDISKDGDERLDAIDTIKRFAYRSQVLQEKNLDASFPSTSSIATATFAEGLLRLQKERTVGGITQRWLAITDHNEMAVASPKAIPFLYRLASKEDQDILKRDGDCYLPETFTPYRLEKDYDMSQTYKSRDLANEGQNVLRNLFAATKENDISRPASYYAMIQMDGDKMGILLGGVETPEEHKSISGSLSTFSRELAPELVEVSYPGRLIYAGGDDVFALAPLARDQVNVQPGETSTVIELVNKLQQQYHNTVADKVPGEKRKKKVTASTGIAIAHHFTALSYVRRVAKEAEETAKKRYGRNALVVTILRRSGEQTRVGCRWRYDKLNDEEQPIELFTAFYNLFNEDSLSPKCIHTLLEEAPTLVKLDKDAQQSEIKRVLKRQRNDKEKLSDEKVETYAARIVKLAQVMDSVHVPRDDQNNPKRPAVELHADTLRYGLVEILGWLLVMEFLTRRKED